MVEMFASRTPVVRCAGAATAVLALAGLAGCGSTKTSTSAATTSMPVVTQSATTATGSGNATGSGDATSTGTSNGGSTSTGTSNGGSTSTRTSNSGSTSTGTANTGTATSTATRSSTGSATRPATGSASSTTGTGTAADTHECRTGQLRAGAYPYTESGVHPETAVTFTNTSSAACSMRGYPGADIRLDGGRVVHAQRFRNAPLTTVVLRPGATAKAIIESLPGSDESGSLVVTPPNQRQSMPVQIVLPTKGFKIGPVTLDTAGN